MHQSITSFLCLKQQKQHFSRSTASQIYLCHNLIMFYQDGKKCLQSERTALKKTI
jgi:hypothetical protein